MDDFDQSELPTETPESSTAPTARLPRLPPGVDKSEEDFRQGQSRILQMIASNAPLGEILKRLVLLIEAQSPEMLCSVLLLSDDGDHIKHGAAPSLPEEYVKAIDGAPIGPKHGSCGTAMYRGEPVVVTDILADPLWADYRDLASPTGLRAGWSTPILSGRGKVLGSFAMYYREPRTPTGDEAGLTDVATRIAGLAIEHQLAREILQRTQVQLAQATHAANTGEAAVSIAHQIGQRLEAVVNNADKCLDLLNEDKPEIVLLREALKNIAGDAGEALANISRVSSSPKK